MENGFTNKLLKIDKIYNNSEKENQIEWFINVPNENDGIGDNNLLK